jgi:Protein of unknown function (DUF4054)
MAVNLATKDPNEVVDYTWNPIPTSDTGDTISGTPTVTSVSGTATHVATNTTTAVKITVSGGADGETAAFELRAMTTGGRVWEETLYIPIATSAYTTLAAKLVQIFPEFANATPAQIKYWLEQSAFVVTWDSDHEKMLMACHYMVLNGLGGTAEAEIHREGLAGATSIKSGTLSLSFAADTGSAQTIESTKYGRQVAPAIRARKLLTVMPTGTIDYGGASSWVY